MVVVVDLSGSVVLDLVLMNGCLEEHAMARLLIINPCIGVEYMLGAYVYDEVSQACVRDHQLKTIGKLHTSIQIQTQRTSIWCRNKSGQACACVISLDLSDGRFSQPTAGLSIL